MPSNVPLFSSVKFKKQSIVLKNNKSAGLDDIPAEDSRYDLQQYTF